MANDFRVFVNSGKFWFFGIFENSGNSDFLGFSENSGNFKKFWKFSDYYNFVIFFGVGPMANDFRVFILTLALTKIVKFQNPY